MTGVINLNLRAPSWATFEAAHVFPLESENLWTQWHLGRRFTDMDGTVGVPEMNSCQNGLMLRSHVHDLFDQYLLSVDPDVGFLPSITILGDAGYL